MQLPSYVLGLFSIMAIFIGFVSTGFLCFIGLLGIFSLNLKDLGKLLSGLFGVLAIFCMAVLFFWLAEWGVKTLLQLL